MMKPATCALALTIALGSACGGDDGNGSAQLVDNLCDADDGVYVRLFSKLFSCIPELELFIGSFPSDAELTEICEDSVTGFVEDGTLRVKRNSARQECLDFIASAECATFDLDTDNPCDEYIDGTQGEGDICDDNLQCAGDSYCDTSDEGSCGACTAQKADGANCFDDSECLGGRCAGSTGTSAGMCRTLGDVGDDCAERDDCLGRLECNATTDKCQMPQDWSAGDTCAEFEECGFPSDELYCDTGAGECKEYAAIGEDCGAAQLCNFVRYESCDLITGKCTVPTIVGIGDTCGLFTGRKCDDGLICEFAPGTAAGLCVATPSEGDSCGGDEDCGDFLLTCVDGMCQYGAYSGMCPMP